jgi:hypothetical protein
MAQRGVACGLLLLFGMFLQPAAGMALPRQVLPRRGALLPAAALGRRALLQPGTRPPPVRIDELLAGLDKAQVPGPGGNPPSGGPQRAPIVVRVDNLPRRRCRVTTGLQHTAA